MKIIRGIYLLPRLIMAAVTIGFILPTMATPPLPREPMPKPSLPGTSQGISKPPVHIGTRPKFDPSNIGALPDLKIVRIRVSLLPQATRACQTGRSYRGGLIKLETTVKNVGQGAADLRRYSFSIRPITADGLSPVFFIRKVYPYGEILSVAPGQTFQIRDDLDVTDVRAGVFPVNRYSELAGKTRRLGIKLLTGSRVNRGLLESNYRNNSKTVRYTFPRNFCQQSALRGGVSQPAGQLPPHLVIQSIRTQLKRPYECRTDGPTFADGDLVLKNTGGDFIPASEGQVFNVDGFVNAGRNRLNLRSVVYLRSRIPAGATRHVRFAMTATAGLLNTPTPSMSVLAGRSVPLRINFWNGVSGNRNSRIRFPADFCASRVVGGISTQVGGSKQTIKPNITGFRFAGGKSCLSPGGRFTLKGSAFGNSAAGRIIELGGNGLSVNLAIKSWNSRAIRVQLPRTARLQYGKNYWLRIKASSRTGAVQILSNLKRGVRLCPPTVRTGTSGSSGNQSAGQQNGGRGINVPTGLPDLIISRLRIANPSPACFAYSDGAGNKKFYRLAAMPATITLKNIGSVAYSTRDRSRNKQLPIGIIGDHFVGHPDRHRLSLCAEPESQNRFSNLNIPAGGSKTIRTRLTIELCRPSHARTARLPQALVNTLLGRSRSINIGIGKAVFIKNKIPQESNYNNNSRRASFRFPNSICAGR